MAGLTRALITRHALGRAEAYDAALLDVAQDHLLYLLSQTVEFGDNRLVFKGGTSLRKCRLGNAGRFSTDPRTRGGNSPWVNDMRTSAACQRRAVAEALHDCVFYNVQHSAARAGPPPKQVERVCDSRSSTEVTSGRS